MVSQKYLFKYKHNIQHNIQRKNYTLTYFILTLYHSGVLSTCHGFFAVSMSKLTLSLKVKELLFFHRKSIPRYPDFKHSHRHIHNFSSNSYIVAWRIFLKSYDVKFPLHLGRLFLRRWVETCAPSRTLDKFLQPLCFGLT